MTSEGREGSHDNGDKARTSITNDTLSSTSYQKSACERSGKNTFGCQKSNYSLTPFEVNTLHPSIRSFRGASELHVFAPSISAVPRDLSP